MIRLINFKINRNFNFRSYLLIKIELYLIFKKLNLINLV